MKPRIAIVSDRDGNWWVRSIIFSVHDWENDRMVYHTDKHLAGPFEDAVDASVWVTDNESERQIEAGLETLAPKTQP